MATLYTFNVTANTYIPTTNGSDTMVTIVGTVNGIGPYSIQVWLSAYESAYTTNGVAGLEALVAPLLLAAYNAANPPPPQPPVNGITGSFTYSL
jgi:hypothetical protein